MVELTEFRVIAQNLPEHSRNPIHTDDGARAAGFPAALVAGVTTYAYLTNPLLRGWGMDWLARGSAVVRLRRPVFAGDVLVCQPVAGERIDGWVNSPGDVRADVQASRTEEREIGSLDAVTEPLRSVTVRLDGDLGSEYAARAGDPLPFCSDAGVVHPAVWPALANHIVHEQLAQGSWVHTASTIRHHDVAAVGATAVIHSGVVRRITNSRGERAVLAVRIEVDDVAVVTIEHDALIRLTTNLDS